MQEIHVGEEEIKKLSGFADDEGQVHQYLKHGYFIKYIDLKKTLLSEKL